MKIKVTSLYVDDQNKALRFYTEVLGFAKKADFSNGPFRWLTVVSPEDPDGTELQLALNNNPAARAYQQAIFQQSQPAAMFFTDDVKGDYERIKARGAEFTMPPTDVTASIIAMLNDPELGRFDLSSLRVIITGGASCPIETIREFRARMHGHLIELYGMLETGFHTYTRLDDDPEAVTGTVGTVSSGLGLRLIDESGRDVAEGAEGEIAAQGPSVHLGYHKNPAANAELFTADGWFRTGDLGQFDRAGNVKIVGRLKEMINRGGKKFFPREIEEILYTHPKILHAAIVGVPDPRLGERNCLCVIPRPGQTLTLDEAVGYLRDSVATYKLPETIEIFDELPFTPTGKIQRHVLARRVLERRGA